MHQSQCYLNRIIVDAWCKLNRALEEKVYLQRDIKLFTDHCVADIDLLMKSERIYPDRISEAERRCYSIVINHKKLMLFNLLKSARTLLN
jgi:hypothetical protein